MTTQDTNTNATATASLTPAMDEITARFLEAVQKNGLAHTLEWIDSWYAKCQLASLQDYYQVHLNNGRVSPQTEFSIAQELINDTGSGKSTLQGANMMKEGRRHALSWMMRGSAPARLLSKQSRDLEEQAAREARERKELDELHPQ